MSDEIDDVVGEMAGFVQSSEPSTISIPATVGDEEALHAVQSQYADAGFECDEDTARSIVQAAR
jgi:hypothetical protein